VRNSKERFGCVYLVTNKLNGKKYVGKTIQKPDHRWNCHKALARNGSATLLHKALRKYSSSAFEFEVIFEGKASELDAAEKHFIDLHHSFVDSGCGYNLTLGGEGGVKSVIVRRKHKVAALRRWSDPEQRATQSESKRLQWLDPTYRAKATACNVGRKLSKKTRQLIAAAKLGKSASMESRLKMSLAHKAQHADPEFKQRHKTAMQKASGKLSKAAKVYWRSEEAHAIQRAAQQLRRAKERMLAAK
jgi:group I intron endonuclease